MASNFCGRPCKSGPESLCFMKEKEASFVGHWSTLFETGFDDSSMSVAPTTISSSLQGKNLTSQEIAEEIKVIGSTTPKPNKTELKEIEDLREMID